jgi:phosphatidylinositol glycan class V
VAFQPLRARQRQISGQQQGGSPQQQQRLAQEQADPQSGNQQQQLLPGLQRLQQDPSGGTFSDRGTADSSSSGADSGKPAGCSCASNFGYYRPELAVFVVHWLVLTLVALAVMHVQVATRFLSSCAPLYWFAALLMLHQGAVLRWLLWWYCFAYMGVGAVMFINFYPWT